jgi:hypothetical protein
VRTKTSVDRKRIARDPAYQRTRENASEFGNASAPGGLLRRALQPLLHKNADGSLPSRLTAAMTAIAKTDLIHTRGNRRVAAGNLPLLKGFALNGNARLDVIFPAPIETRKNLLQGLIDTSIPSFVPADMIAFPPGATHFSIVNAVITLDFGKKEWRRDIQKTALMSLEAVTNPIQLLHHTDNSDQDALVHVLGIEFFQELNGAFYILKNGGYNGLVVMDAVSLAAQQQSIPETMPVEEKTEAAKANASAQPLPEKLLPAKNERWRAKGVSLKDRGLGVADLKCFDYGVGPGGQLVRRIAGGIFIENKVVLDEPEPT